MVNPYPPTSSWTSPWTLLHLKSDPGEEFFRPAQLWWKVISVSKHFDYWILMGVMSTSKWGVSCQILMPRFWDMGTLTSFFWGPWKIDFTFLHKRKIIFIVRSFLTLKNYQCINRFTYHWIDLVVLDCHNSFCFKKQNFWKTKKRNFHFVL